MAESDTHETEGGLFVEDTGVLDNDGNLPLLNNAGFCDSPTAALGTNDEGLLIDTTEGQFLQDSLFDISTSPLSVLHEGGTPNSDLLMKGDSSLDEHSQHPAPNYEVDHTCSSFQQPADAWFDLREEKSMHKFDVKSPYIPMTRPTMVNDSEQMPDEAWLSFKPVTSLYSWHNFDRNTSRYEEDCFAEEVINELRDRRFAKLSTVPPGCNVLGFDKPSFMWVAPYLHFDDIFKFLTFLDYDGKQFILSSDLNLN